MSADAHTFFWHDYETFGADPRRDRPAQFAGLRTDADLNPMGEPVVWYCQPAQDYLPDPESCLIPGITPQQCQARGMSERAFAEALLAELERPGTIGVGYNSIRFDDEFTRHLLWRNLLDPYGREWRNGCSRWDLLDVVRMTWALRPAGIEWPTNGEGKPSFRLEHLTAANGLAHEQAHDALSDVYATLALARLIRQRQPRLFDYALGLRRRDRVLQVLGLPANAGQVRPFVHVSGRFPVERGCLAVMWPLAQHPTNRNELLAWDLAHDPRELADLRPDEARRRLFTRQGDLPEGVRRLPLKSVHLNRSPMVVAGMEVLRSGAAERFGLDLAQIERHAAWAAGLPDRGSLWAALFGREPGQEAVDVDAALYDGFVGDDDRRRLMRLRALDPADPAWRQCGFDDARLPELVFRFRARNHPQSLDADERARWRAHCRARIVDGAGGHAPWADYRAQLEARIALARAQGDARALGLLAAVADYASERVAAVS
ncbi:Exodeoxyribonuclease I [Tepidimonas thermarum]|uniref:Exodeoxyribonuclease I n=1 Tax=Tepidimonas thermarum TaxID=335431 RepID=A0A554X0D4_9BURK|nr:exodeoxyribonuclease I [Tepidimonas thermarum]TSE29311.1 Exodeoxyribonuclease I [Tepidimonas thermarum]